MSSGRPYSPTGISSADWQARYSGEELRSICSLMTAAPAALLHRGQQAAGQLAVAREVQRQRLVPLLVGRVLAERAAAAGVVDQDLHGAERVRGRSGDPSGRVGLPEVHGDDRAPGGAGGLDLPRPPLPRRPAPGGGGGPRSPPPAPPAPPRAGR